MNFQNFVILHRTFDAPVLLFHSYDQTPETRTIDLVLPQQMILMPRVLLFLREVELEARQFQRYVRGAALAALAWHFEFLLNEDEAKQPL